MDNVTNISEGIPEPLSRIVRRRAEIKTRQGEIRTQTQQLTEELNQLYYEDRELEQAEVAVRKLLAR